MGEKDAEDVYFEPSSATNTDIWYSCRRGEKSLCPLLEKSCIFKGCAHDRTIRTCSSLKTGVVDKHVNVSNTWAHWLSLARIAVCFESYNWCYLGMVAARGSVRWKMAEKRRGRSALEKKLKKVDRPSAVPRLDQIHGFWIYIPPGRLIGWRHVHHDVSHT